MAHQWRTWERWALRSREPQEATSGHLLPVRQSWPYEQLKVTLSAGASQPTGP